MLILTKEQLRHCDELKTDSWDKESAYAGGFRTDLMNAISRADAINRLKLSLVYPNTVRLFERFAGLINESED